MKKSLRIISVILSALMLMSIFAVMPVSAADKSVVMTGAKTGKIGSCEWVFSELDKKLIITGNGATPDLNISDKPWQEFESDIEIVEVQDGITVIGERFFNSLFKLKKAIIADSVTEIKFCAFTNCYELEEVKLPASLKILESSAFDYTALKSVTLPEGLEEIQSSAFYGCTNLQDVTVPASVKFIEQSAFVNTGMKSITILGKNTDLQEHSVGYTYGLIDDKNVFKPVEDFNIICDKDSLAQKYKEKLAGEIPPETNITWSFDSSTGTLTLSGTGETPVVNDAYPAPWKEHLDKITKLVVNEGITAINWVGDCRELYEVSLPDSLEKINKNAFDTYNELHSLKFGKGLKEIGSYAFSGCDLYNLTLPDSVKKIGEGAFSYNASLSKVNLGKGVEEIGEIAFYECSMMSVSIPKNVKTIGKKAFGYYYDERWVPDSEDGHTNYDDFLKTYFTVYADAGSAGAKYAMNNGAVLITGTVSLNKKSVSLKAGKVFKLTKKNYYGSYSFKSSNKKIATVDKDGKVVALKKGTATITFTAKKAGGDIKLTCKVKVTSNPTIKIGKKKFKKSTRYSIKKGKSLTVKITGKASTVKNTYKTSNKKIAKITSKKTAAKVKIKAYKKKGKATITLVVNGVTFKIKVKVK